MRYSLNFPQLHTSGTNRVPSGRSSQIFARHFGMKAHFGVDSRTRAGGHFQALGRQVPLHLIE
jgi:hypothetical protein